MQQQQQAPPPAQGMTPQQYFMTLYQQGYSASDAYAAVQQNFGPPKTPEQLRQEQAQANSNAQLAATGGQVAGVIGTSYLLGQLGGAAGASAGAGAGGGAVLGSTLAGGAGASGGMATAGAGAGAMGGGALGSSAAGAGAAGAGTAGAGAGGAGAAGAGLGAVAIPAAIAAAAAIAANNAWETGMKDIVRGRGTREDYINQAINHVSGINLGLRLLGKPSIGSRMTSGKSRQQKIRDDFRSKLRETGVADDKYQVTLADGSKFDIGLDGKHKFVNTDGKTERHPWDGDSSNPLSNYATGIIDPTIKRIYEGAPEDMHTEQFTGMLVNAAISNAKTEADVDKNIAAMLGQSPFVQQQMQGGNSVDQAINPILRLPQGMPNAAVPIRPPEGEALRVSPGLYRIDSGELMRAKTLRDALEQAYGKSN